MKTYNKLYDYKKENHYKLKFDVKGDKDSESRTQQEHADPANINNIIKKYKEIGVLSSGDIKTQKIPMYGDFASMNFREALEKVTEIKNAFSMLSAEERAGYYNNPENWVKAMEFAEKLKIKTASDEAEAKEKEYKVVEGVKQTEKLKTETTEKNDEKTEAVSQTS